MTEHADSGRGRQATADMKARIAALRADGADGAGIVEALWERHYRAVLGAGYTYEFAGRRDELSRYE